MGDPNVEFIGEIGEKREKRISRQRLRLPFPHRLARTFWVNHDRSHGLRYSTIAFNCGSVPEVMQEGLTGFIVNDMDQAVAAVGK